MIERMKMMHVFMRERGGGGGCHECNGVYWFGAISELTSIV